jgi:MFS family permease
MKKLFWQFGENMLASLKDLAPIIVVISFFQLLVLQQPIPNLVQVLFGLLLVTIGLALFVMGLKMALFPLGEGLAYSFASYGSISLLFIFSFLLGFGTTIAEPALLAITNEAAQIAATNGTILNTKEDVSFYANGLRWTVALAVGFAIVTGVWRILRGTPIAYWILTGYLLVIIITTFAPDDIISIAYDLGGVTTSTITVPLVTALGVGLATSIKGRNPIIDGFGLIAFASLTPMIFVLLYGIIMQ